MIKLSAGFFFIPVFILILFSCTSNPEPPIAKEIPAEAVKPAEEPPAASEPVETPSDTPQKNTEYIVTQELFKETFVNIEALIGELNQIIMSKNYATWLTYLTKEYINTYSSPEKLYEISQQPTLKKYNIRLRSLEDYFHYVVVPSRSEARLDDLIFNDESHIHAIMLFNGKRSILYSLEKINNVWKIGI